jgi:hypothetical protein
MQGGHNVTVLEAAARLVAGIGLLSVEIYRKHRTPFTA